MLGNRGSVAPAAWMLGLCLIAVSTSLEAASWKRAGGTGVAAGFAGPVGRPVEDAWFSASGTRLYALLEDSLWASDDEGLTWSIAESDPDGVRATLQPQPIAGSAIAVVQNPFRSGVAYALGEHLYRSDDGGREWLNLTALGSESVIGRWQTTLAVSPRQPQLIVVGNSMGLWKSYDEGATWASLNTSLPNFPRAHFARTRPSATRRLESEQLGALELVRTSAGATWRASQAPRPPSSIPLSERPRAQAVPRNLPEGFDVSHRVWKDGKPISGDLAGCAEVAGCDSAAITALASNGRLWAGTSTGRLWVSADAGKTWSMLWEDPDQDAVVAIWADPGLPATALALVGSRVLRSTNGGTSWFDISSDLPESAWTTIQGDSTAGTVYVAGNAGIYFAQVDLQQPGPASSWVRISGNLPEAEIVDLDVDARRGRLWVSLPGRGVYWTRTPQVDRALQVLSAADLTTRPAAPGSLLTLLGAQATRVRADGRPAPILDSATGRTQVQLPFAIAGRSVRLQVDAEGTSRLVDVPLRDVSPAVFIVGGEPLILNAGTGALVSWMQPAQPGASIFVMATGLGAVAPPWPAGVPSREIDPPRTVARVEANIGGEAAKVVASHLAPGYVGIYLVEIEIPANAVPGSLQLWLHAEGKRSNQVSLVVGR